MTGAFCLRTVLCAAVLSLGTFLQSRDASAAVIISFTNGDSFDGDNVGDTAGPFFDAMTGVVGTITTTSLPPAGQLNSTSGQIGISPGANGNAFDPDEFWGFVWDVDTTFQHVDFSSFSTASETFTIRSDDWIGQGFVPTDSDITFVAATGAFEFGSGDSSDDFNLFDLNSGNPIPLLAGSEVLFAMAGGGSDSARISAMTFGLSGAAVPEPNALSLLVAIGLIVGAGRRVRGKASARLVGQRHFLANSS